MEPNVVPLAVAVAVGLVLAAALLYRLRGRRQRHKTTKAGLRQLALEQSEALIALIREREARRPGGDAANEDHEKAQERATMHDEELRLIYRNDHLPQVKDLREQLAARGIRDEALDDVYATVRSEAELRTVSTALLVMADRLR